MPTSPFKQFEYEIAALIPSEKVNMINVRLNHLHKLKSEGKDTRLTDYYIEKLTKVKEDTYKYSVYSHLGYIYLNIVF